MILFYFSFVTYFSSSFSFSFSLSLSFFLLGNRKEFVRYQSRLNLELGSRRGVSLQVDQQGCSRYH